MQRYLHNILLDSSILQSKTVYKIVELLKIALASKDSKDLIDVCYFIIEEVEIASKSGESRKANTVIKKLAKLKEIK